MRPHPFSIPDRARVDLGNLAILFRETSYQTGIPKVYICDVALLVDGFIAIIDGTVGVLKVLVHDKQALQQPKGMPAPPKSPSQRGEGKKKTIKILFDGGGLFKSGEAEWHGS